MKLLSVDDSRVVRKIMRGAAEVLDYELLEAEDGIQGLEVMAENYQDIAVILLDWNMPRMNGLEFLQAVKGNPDYRGIPVMMVTTETERDSIITAIQEGAANYMVKPFTMEELVKNILETLGKGEGYGQ